MGKALLVHQSYAAENLRCDVLRLVLGQPLHVRQVFLQVSILAILHGDVEPSGAFVPAEEFDEELGVLLMDKDPSQSLAGRPRPLSIRMQAAGESDSYLVLRKVGQRLELADVVSTLGHGAGNPDALDGAPLLLVCLPFVLHPALQPDQAGSAMP